MRTMARRHPMGERGQVNIIAALLLVAAVVTGVWIWKRLSYETQDIVIEQAIPVAVGVAASATAVWLLVRAIRQRRQRREQRARLIERFRKTSSPDKRREIAFDLIELNQYRRTGLEEIAPAMQEVFATTLTRALGDKQHQIRGLAASHLGVIGDASAVQVLLKALEDDHAYVRSCAALGLGRLRASEAKERLKTVSVEDWDQTVRSRAREAVERIP